MMKNNYFIPFLLVAMFIFSGCPNEKVREPNQVGKQVFDILKNFNLNSKQDFLDNFMTYDEIREFVTNKETMIEKEVLDELVRFNEENLSEVREKQYDYINSLKGRWEINLEDIEYVDFKYKMSSSDNISEGELFVKTNNYTHKFIPISFYVGGEYKLMIIDTEDWKMLRFVCY